ncbi:MAG: hypothetical protein ACREVI_09995 [Steroidobacteraceae bacterium]
MSLTSLLKQRDIKERFKTEFVKPKITLSAGDTFAPPSAPKRCALIGTAFDYLARLHVSIINRSVSTDSWVAETAVHNLERAIASGRPVFAPEIKRSTRGLLKRARTIAREGREEFERCILAREVSDRMLASALLLGQLDQFYRCSLLSREFGKTNELDIADLRNLLAILRGRPSKNFVASKVCVLNPGFGEASALVGGGDADLLVDDTLIELKVRKKLEFDLDTFHQLLGYYALSKIGGLDCDIRPKPVIRNIALYSARYGAFHKIPVDSVVHAKTFPKFLRWFSKRAKYGPTGRLQVMRLPDGITVHF